MKDTYPASINDLESHNASTTSHANGFDNPVLVIAKTDISNIDPTVNGLYDMGDVSIRTSDKKTIGNIGVDLNVRDGIVYRDGYIQVLSDSEALENTVAQLTISISPDGTEKYILTNAILKDVNATSPTADTHVATKKYVDDTCAGFPDYSNEQDVDVGTPENPVTSYTAPNKGWVYVYYVTPINGDNSQFVTFYINKNPVYAFGTAHANRHGVLLPINKNDVVTGVDDNNDAIGFTKIVFYPMK